MYPLNPQFNKFNNNNLDNNNIISYSLFQNNFPFNFYGQFNCSNFPYNWITLGQNGQTEYKLSYKLMFWNILCDHFSFDWKTSPKIELKYKVWEHRSKLFLSLLSDTKNICDLYCFVEMDKQTEIFNMLNNVITNNAYNYIHFPRPKTPLGIMLVYNKYKFTLIEAYKYPVNLNFVFVAILQENLGCCHNKFCVLIGHLAAWEKNEDKRIKQIELLMNSLKNDKKLKYHKINSYILCADLNTNPDSICVKKILGNNFISAFDLDIKNKNYTMVIDTIDEGMKMLKFDYIFSTANIEILSKNMPLYYLNFEKGMPNENYPSDHLFLTVEFSFKPKQQQKRIYFKGTDDTNYEDGKEEDKSDEKNLK